MNISNTIKTPRNGDANRPFGIAPMVKQPARDIDLKSLVICDDPLPTRRASPDFKYQPLFDKMKINQCIKCQPDEIGRVGGALRKWIEVNKKPGGVRSIRNFGDGLGRVWWLDLPSKRIQSH